jgi:uncharacterized protein (DUF1778 family)
MVQPTDRAASKVSAHARVAASASPKSERIALRVTSAQRVLLDEACRTEETTLSEFVLHAATRRAEDVLADRRRFVLSAEAWKSFVELLDRPAIEKPRLRRLMSTPSILEQ